MLGFAVLVGLCHEPWCPCPSLDRLRTSRDFLAQSRILLLTLRLLVLEVLRLETVDDQLFSRILVGRWVWSATDKRSMWCECSFFLDMKSASPLSRKAAENGASNSSWKRGFLGHVPDNPHVMMRTMPLRKWRG